MFNESSFCNNHEENDFSGCHFDEEVETTYNSVPVETVYDEDLALYLDMQHIKS